MHWSGWVDEVERARASFAALIGADPGDVAVGTSESQLASSVVSALVSSPGERRRIVSSTLEFPGVGQAWEAATRYGWRVDRVRRDASERLTPDDLVTMVDDSTALVSMPHVVYANGTLVDPGPVIEAAHAAGALCYVDAYQSLGTIPIDVHEMDVDLLAGGVLKYLMGTAGIAFLYVSPRIRERLEPTVTGWFGRVDPFAFDPTWSGPPASRRSAAASWSCRRWRSRRAPGSASASMGRRRRRRRGRPRPWTRARPTVPPPPSWPCGPAA
jgi:selenocysteine lyase/cysteine desulfurase